MCGSLDWMFLVGHSNRSGEPEPLTIKAAYDPPTLGNKAVAGSENVAELPPQA